MNSELIFELTNWVLRRPPTLMIGPLSLRLLQGEILTLMGPSGVGKTSTLLGLLGYEDPLLQTKGARCDHRGPLRDHAVPRNAVYIPQGLPFNPNWEILGFLCRLPWGQITFRDRFIPANSSRQRVVLRVLDELGLAHRARATAAQLSGGEAQRAAIAQVILLKPKLIVADELISALDPGMAASILDRLQLQIRQTGAGAILALHDVQAAIRVSNKILLMWPTAVQPVPWLIERHSPAWRFDALYTCLCISRWLVDASEAVSAIELLSLLNNAINETLPDSVQISPVSDLVPSHIMIRDGVQRITDDALLRRAIDVFDEHRGSSDLFVPLRFVEAGDELVGFAIRGAGGRPRRIVIAVLGRTLHNPTKEPI